MFGHEKFKAYQLALDFIVAANQLIEKIPRGNAHLVDQLRRASMSIALNIAEGSGKTSRKDKIRFYSIARGSALECGAILDVLGASGLLDEDEKEGVKGSLSEVSAILSAICLREG